MHFVISDSQGNTVDTFDDQLLAENALLGMVVDDPADERHLLLLTYEDDGTPVGTAQLAEDVRARRFLTMPWGFFFQPTTSTVCSSRHAVRPRHTTLLSFSVSMVPGVAPAPGRERVRA